jgi:hypothetical protein
MNVAVSADAAPAAGIAPNAVYPTLRRADAAPAAGAESTCRTIAAQVRAVLESTHRLYRDVERDVPEGLTQREAAGTTSLGVRHSALMIRAYAAFRDALTGFLTLHNMTATAEHNNVTEILLGRSESEFAAWLDAVERQGSPIA